jgi:micrococcal nuclease
MRPTMTIRRKNCRYCGRPIELREGADGTWRAYDRDGSLHDCPARPASAQARSAPPAQSGTRAPAAPTARRSAPLWLVVVGLLALLGWYALGGNREAGPGDPAVDAPPAPTHLARPEPTRPPPRATDRAGERPSSAAAGGEGCAAFANQVWAQTVYDSASRIDPALDPDRDGLACEDLPPGAAPALWTDRIPAAAEPVALRSTIDGDTITVQTANGRRESVRLVGIDTPETGKGSRALECYGPEASAFTAGLLGGIDTVWLERDVEDRDRYDRLLRYVWFERDGRVYLANEAIVRSGAAERFRDTPNRRYLDELVAAEAFAREHGYGRWGACR